MDGESQGPDLSRQLAERLGPLFFFLFLPTRPRWQVLLTRLQATNPIPGYYLHFYSTVMEHLRRVLVCAGHQGLGYTRQDSIWRVSPSPLTEGADPN